MWKNIKKVRIPSIIRFEPKKILKVYFIDNLERLVDLEMDSGSNTNMLNCDFIYKFD